MNPSQNESLSRENCTDLKENEENKKKAFLLLEKAQEKIGEIFDENEMTGLLEEALVLACDSADIFLKTASLYFSLGKKHSKSQFLFRSHHFYNKAFAHSPDLFSGKSSLWHQWANLHVELYQHLQEENLLVEAIKKFEAGEKWVDPKSSEAFLYFWDFAKAWLLSAFHSQELIDLSKSIEKFKKANLLDVTDPAFFNDYGDALFLLGRRNSEESFIRSAIECYKKGREKEERRAWIQICFAAKEIPFFTGKKADLETADQLFRDALLSFPDCADLWLEWGDLYLRFGWINKDISFIEKGLEKITSLKMAECSPLLTAALLGMGTTMMGLFLDNFKLLKEGRETLLGASAFSSHYPPLLLSLGFSDLAFGIYFDEPQAIERALSSFESTISQEPQVYFPYFGCYEAYIVLAMMRGEKSLLEKGLDYLKQLSLFRPKLPQLYLDWGLACFRFAELHGGEKIEESLEKLAMALLSDRSEDALFVAAKALTLHGDLKGEVKRFEEALELLKELVCKNPKMASYHCQRAMTLSHLGEMVQDVDLLMESVAMMEIFVKREKENEILLVELGYTYLLLSQWHENEEKQMYFLRKAEKELQKAAGLGHEEAHYHLACLYSIVGDVKRSLHFLKCSLNFGVIEQWEIEEEEWLENLKKSDCFKKFLAQES